MYYSTIRQSKRQSGYTLVELTVAVLIGMMIAIITLTLFNTQLASFGVLRTQDFMMREAPQVNSILNKLIPKADSLLVYNNASEVKTGTPVKSGGKAVLLRFRGPGINQSTHQLITRYAVVAFEKPNGADLGDLNVYSNLSNLSTSDFTSPSWKISTEVKDASFFIENGVLRIRLTGPNDGEIIYSASPL